MNSTLHAVASGPGRPGPSRSEEIIAGGEGELFIRSWRPAGVPRAVLAIVPGFNSHSGHYLWAAEQFTAMGLAVYAVDLRGRGKSSGPTWTACCVWPAHASPACRCSCWGTVPVG